MQAMFTALLKLIEDPTRQSPAIKTDNSVLLVYPPDKELDFREYLLDRFVPLLQAKKIPFRLLDLTGFLFSGLTEEGVASVQEDEFDDYRWMQQGLSKRLEAALPAHLTAAAAEIPGGAVLVYATAALHPLVRYGEVLRGLRDIEARVVLAFPGEERGGKLHFMNQPDGGDYLAIKLFWR
jgi:hypothetical protein